MKFKYTLLLVLALLSAATMASNTEYKIGGTETVTIRSKVNKQEYDLYVKLPWSYAKEKKSYPVAILSDSGFSFPIVSGVVDLMGGRDIEEVIVVGVSYSKNTTSEVSRTRDYTPTYAPNEKGAHSQEAQKQSGRASEYLEFLEKEALPLLSKKYRINQQNKIYIGHSFGGLLGVYTLLTKPNIFNTYIIGSPSLWYDNKAIFRIEEQSSDAKISINANVFMYIGSEETKNIHKSMVDDVFVLEKKLRSRNHPDLHIQASLVNGATHFSAFPIFVTEGLKRAIPKLGG